MHYLGLFSTIRRVDAAGRHQSSGTSRCRNLCAASEVQVPGCACLYRQGIQPEQQRHALALHLKWSLRSLSSCSKYLSCDVTLVEV